MREAGDCKVRNAPKPARPERPFGVPALQSELILEFGAGLRSVGRTLSGASPRVDHTGGYAADRLGRAPD